MTLTSLGIPPPVAKPTVLGNSNSVTPHKGEGETKTGSEMINQAPSSLDYSVLTPTDFGVTPDSFTKHQSKCWGCQK